MATTLSDAQRNYAQHHLLFDRPLSMEMNEAIFRASIARADNERTETGLPELFCALYLQHRGELENYFDGVPELVNRIFAKHRFDVEGLSPEQAVASAANEQEDTAGTGVVWELRLSDDAVQLLWQASRFANIVGKKASLKDVLAALTVRAEWLNELRQLGVTLKTKLTNLNDVLFFTWAHTGSKWPTEAQFSAGRQKRPVRSEPNNAVRWIPAGSIRHDQAQRCRHLHTAGPDGPVAVRGHGMTRVVSPRDTYLLSHLLACVRRPS